MSSIHTYRDALVREADAGRIEGFVHAAYLLSPQIPATATGYRETPMPGAVVHPDTQLPLRRCHPAAGHDRRRNSDGP